MTEGWRVSVPTLQVSAAAGPGRAGTSPARPGAQLSGRRCRLVALEDEVVPDPPRAVSLVLQVQDQLHGLDDVAVDPLTAAEVQLGGDGRVRGEADDHV